jgi:predicted  nucleic acid-binding Zn-ribbon protein
MELGKVTEEADSQKLGGLCSQFSMELRNTKEELAKLYRENKDLRGQLRAQEDHIQSLNVHYTDQTECLKQELAELRNALYGLEGQQGISTDDLPPLRSEPCCQLF